MKKNKAYLISREFIDILGNDNDPGETGACVKIKIKDYEETDFYVLPLAEKSVDFWEAFKGLQYSEVLAISAFYGLTEEFIPGAWVGPTDHLNFMNDNPLIRYFRDKEARFYDIKSYYEDKRSYQLDFIPGVYAALDYPCSITPAEMDYYLKAGANSINYDLLPSIMMAFAVGKKINSLGVTVCRMSLTEKNALNEEILKGRLKQMITP